MLSLLSLRDATSDNPAPISPWAHPGTGSLSAPVKNAAGKALFQQMAPKSLQGHGLVGLGAILNGIPAPGLGRDISHSPGCSKPWERLQGDASGKVGGSKSPGQGKIWEEKFPLQAATGNSEPLPRGEKV